MFLNLLTERQKATFLALATKIILADGKIMPEEEVTLDLRIAEMGGHVRAPAEEIYGRADLHVFDSRRSRIIVLIELYVLVMSDRRYAPQEQEVMAPLIDEWSITEDEATVLRRWAEKAAPLSVIGWRIVVADDFPAPDF